jgi:hypothetical protein
MPGLLFSSYSKDRMKRAAEKPSTGQQQRERKRTRTPSPRIFWSLVLGWFECFKINTSNGRVGCNLPMNVFRVSRHEEVRVQSQNVLALHPPTGHDFSRQTRQIEQRKGNLFNGQFERASQKKDPGPQRCSNTSNNKRSSSF